MNPFIQNLIDVGKNKEGHLVKNCNKPREPHKAWKITYFFCFEPDHKWKACNKRNLWIEICLDSEDKSYYFRQTMIGKLNYTYVYPSCYCILKTNSRYFIFLDIPDHNGLTISPSEREFLDFSGLLKHLNAKHSMDHGGVLLKPPVALPTLDLHHHDQKFVKPA